MKLLGQKSISFSSIINHHHLWFVWLSLLSTGQALFLRVYPIICASEDRDILHTSNPNVIFYYGPSCISIPRRFAENPSVLHFSCRTPAPRAMKPPCGCVPVCVTVVCCSWSDSAARSSPCFLGLSWHSWWAGCQLQARFCLQFSPLASSLFLCYK